MKVFHLISSGGFYGAENMLLTLAGALASMECRCVIAVFQDSRRPHTEIAELARQQGAQVEIVPCSGRFDWKAVRRISHLIVAHRPDVVHTHGYKADLYGYLATRRRAALISTCHNWASAGWRMVTYQALDRAVLRRFDGVAAVSEALAGFLQRSGVKGVRCVTNGVDLERFQSVPGSRGRGVGFDRVAGFVGRLSPEKGGDVLLHAARHVVAVRPRTEIVFAGEGPSRRTWEELAKQLGISKNVRFEGRRDDIERVYATLDVLVLPSRNEGTPMCLLEAMAAGVPVVATRVGGVSSLVIPGVTGMLVDAEDATSLARAILTLFDDRRLAESIAGQARARVFERFSARAMARNYASFYNEVLATAPVG